jgi:hypothetical protein
MKHSFDIAPRASSYRNKSGLLPPTPSLPLLRTQQLILDLLHLHILHAIRNLRFLFIKHLLTYRQDLVELVFVET